jgi:hypothetical protein
MMNSISFLITTFLRDSLLYKSVQSLIDNYFEGMNIVIIDQGNPSKEKTEWMYTLPNYCYYFTIKFDSGLSAGRNMGVAISKEFGCEYTFIASDSFLFNESIKKTPSVIHLLDTYGLVGFSLKNSTCRWEGKLNLIESKCFEIDFCDPNNPIDFPPFKILECEIMRNFFIARTDILLTTKWDENLLLGEHEDEFYRLKLQGVKCCWTKDIFAEKMNDNPPEYLKYRKQNFNEGIKKLLQKYQITSWISYKNHQWCNIKD